MVKKIKNMILDDYDHGVLSLWIDFSSGDKGLVDCIDTPKTVSFEIETQVTKDGSIVALDLIDIEAFLKSDGFSYLPDLGEFEFESYKGTLKDIIYHDLIVKPAKARKKTARA